MSDLADTDQDSVRHLLCGDYVRIHGKLMTSAKRMVAGRLDAEDLVQIVVLSALENGDVLIARKSIIPFLNRIMFRKLCDMVSVTSHKFRSNVQNLGGHNTSLNDEDAYIPAPQLWTPPRQESFCYLIEVLRIGKRELTPLEYEAIVACIWPPDDGDPVSSRSTLTKARQRLADASGEPSRVRGRLSGEYIGVRRKHRKFAARYASKHIGYFASAELAAKACDQAVIESEGQCGRLNFPSLEKAA